MGDKEQPVFDADEIETDGPEVDGQQAELPEGVIEEEETDGNA